MKKLLVSVILSLFAISSLAQERIIITTRAGVSDSHISHFVKGAKVRSLGANNYVLVVPADVKEQLSKNPHIKHIEIDRKVHFDLAVNDPYFGSQWHTTKIGANTAWDITLGEGIIVAILDSGVETTHPDLSSRTVPGWNTYDNNSNTSDVHGHGTAVAGTAAATLNNGIGVAGIAGYATIMPVRISQPDGWAYWSDIAEGVIFAADNRAKVANISYAVASSTAIRSAAQYMRSKGGIVVVSAGNDGIDPGWPTAPELVVVSATDSTDNRTSWSSFGTYVTISAPGIGIWTTRIGGTYGSGAGTSFSSPIVAGTAALIYATKPGITVNQVENVLYSTAVDIGTIGKDIYYGYGRVNAAAAVQAAMNIDIDSISPNINITYPVEGTVVSGLIPINISAIDNVEVVKVILFVDGIQYATDTSTPFGFSWDTSLVTNGNHVLQAQAYDAANNVGISSNINILVSNSIDTIPPVINITAPLNNQTISGTYTVKANATDNVAVSKVEFLVNGKAITTDTAAPYSFNFNTRKYTGINTIEAKAYDTTNNVSSSTVTINISNGKR